MSLVGVDIGGTNIRVGVVAPSGKLLQRLSAPTRPERGPDATLATVVAMIHTLTTGSTHTPQMPTSIGIGITGPVDPRTGVVDNPHTLGGWPPTDVTTPIRREFPGIPVVIDNDANAAAMGEWCCSAGEGSRRFSMVTVGTGIGVAFLIDGEIQRSGKGRHGEAGHMVLDASGPPCYCGARGCWEALASGTALHQRLNGAPFDMSSPIARTALRETARWLGIGLVNICSVFCPDEIAIGGGVAAHFAVIEKTLVESLRQHRTMVPTDINVRAARLGDDAGVIGAALLLPTAREPAGRR